ncbi:hypothetical protein [Quadrisphaera setariae]|nr:hypothetical protein [Quadrisphaera setariae]
MSTSTEHRDVVLSIDAPRSRPSALQHHRLEDMKGGWFIGDFAPAAMRCAGAEVAVKHVRAGTHEPLHEHRLATEATVVVAGRIRIGGEEWRTGDIIVVLPHTKTDFTAITDAVLVVVKTPSVIGDKYAVALAPDQVGLG